MKKWKWLAVGTSTVLIGSTVSFTGYPTALAAQTTVQYGSQGPAVTLLQQDLTKLGDYHGTVNGDFGQDTLVAVKSFQSSSHLSVDGIVGPMTWSALAADVTKATGSAAPAVNVKVSKTLAPVSAQYTLNKSSVTWNGNPAMNIFSFVHNGTTYMPIYYLEHLLEQFQIKSTWQGTDWVLTFPATTQVSLDKISLEPGSDEISLNNTAVIRLTGIPYHDPYSDSIITTYMPIYDIQVALTRAGIHTAWNGSTWAMTEITGYTAYTMAGTEIGSFATLAAAQTAVSATPGAVIKDSSGAVVSTEPNFAAYTKTETLVGNFITESAAQAALSNSPGGTVVDEDQSGTVVYTEPDFTAYTAPGATPSDYVTISAAQNAVSGYTDGYVVNDANNQVVVLPNNVYTDNSGIWTSSAYGPRGTFVPPYAVPGAVYLATDDGNSPYFSQIFLLSQNGQYVGKAEGQWENPFRTVDLRFPAPSTVTASQIDNWLGQNNSPMQGLGASFIQAQNTYGVDATYLVAHAILESAWGNSQIAMVKDNLFGYGAYDSNPGSDAGMFPSYEYAILFEGWEVRNNYLNPGSSHFYNWPTLDGMNEDYATGHTWAGSIATLMNQYVNQNGGSEAAYTQYSTSDNAPAAQSTTEPVYLVDGALGTVTSNPYTNLPVYSSPSSGGSEIFPGTLSVGSQGPAVEQLQQALNQNGANPPLTVDGGYGPLTQAAVESYQQSHGLPVTGVCTLDVWNSLFPQSTSSTQPTLATGSQVTIDQMEQGMSGGFVVEWYHITSGNISGWVDGQYIALNNVYRATATSGYTVTIYSTPSTASATQMTIHSGDWVVLPTGTTATGGFVQAQLMNQDTGAAVTGYIDSSAVQFTQMNPSAALS